MSEQEAEARRLADIRREHRHALATRRDPGDSWLNGYQDDVGFLLAALAKAEQTASQLRAERDEAKNFLAQTRAGAHILERRSEAAEARERKLREAIEEYSLWEPGRAGHATAHRRLMAALQATQEDGAA
jgi:hypothetical protein